MRYFKYSDPWPDLEAERNEYAECCQRQQKRNEHWHVFGNIVFISVFLIVFVGLIVLLSMVLPKGDSAFDVAFRFLGYGFGGLIGFICGIVLGSFASIPFWNIDKEYSKSRMLQLMQKSTEHLRKYYEYQEPCLVTKCYRCSDRNWNRHDVCLFVVGDELRITINLQYGFFRPERDLGCYSFLRQDILLKDALFRDTPAVELQADGVSFILSRNAISFIKKHFE